MITKSDFKDYKKRQCLREIWLNQCDKNLLGRLKSLLAIDSNNDLDVSEHHEEYNNEQQERLAEFMKDYPHVYEEMNHEPLFDPISQFVLDMKDFQEVGHMAHVYLINKYPGSYKRADTVNGELDGKIIYDNALIEANTQRYLSDPTIHIIFEGQVSIDSLTARWDALIRDGDTLHLIEVKGSNSINHKQKPIGSFYDDVFFQYHVYQKANLDISKISILHLNADYQLTLEDMGYPPKQSLINNLFTLCETFNTKDGTLLIKDYIDQHSSEDVSLLSTLINHLPDCSEVCPEAVLTYACGNCEYKTSCHNIHHDHILKLTANPHADGHFSRKQKIMGQGIDKISAIINPATYGYGNKNEGNHSMAELQINYAKNFFSHKMYVDQVVLKSKLAQYKYPLVFFDFESFMYPIPLVKEMKPWAQVCSQYSMHVVTENYNLEAHDYKSGTGGGITHYEYIGSPIDDLYERPDYKLLIQLQKDLQDQGIDWETDDFSIVVYNRSFEETRFKEMKGLYPHFVPFIDRLLQNVCDLYEIVCKGVWYHESLHGKSGLKSITHTITTDQDILDRYSHLPNFHENLDYSLGLIKNGSMALDAYQSLLRSVLLGNNTPLHENILIALKHYCKIDTWATVIYFDLLNNC